MNLKALLVTLCISFSSSAFAEMVTCKGDGFEGRPSKMTLKFNSENQGSLKMKFTTSGGETTSHWAVGPFKRSGRTPNVTFTSGEQSLSFTSFTTPGENLEAIFTFKNGHYENARLICKTMGELTPPQLTCPTGADLGNALVSASRTRKADKMRQLIECDADVNFVDDKRGCTPLLYVLDRDCGTGLRQTSNGAKVAPMVSLLLENGANLEMQDPMTLSTPLIKAVKNSDIDVTRDLIAAGSNLDAQNVEGDTPLIFAVASGFELLAKYVLDGDPDLSIKNNRGLDAIDVAKEYGYAYMEDLLNADVTLAEVTGQEDGSCSPTMIHVSSGTKVKFELKASETKMFTMKSEALGIDLMAMPEGTSDVILTLEESGTFEFTCGVHGGLQTTGQIMVM